MTPDYDDFQFRPEKIRKMWKVHLCNLEPAVASAMTWSSTYVLLVFICIYILKILGELSTYLRKSVLKHIAT